MSSIKTFIDRNYDRFAGALVGWLFMRNSREKYGETTGANDGIYGVEGVFEEQMIGRQILSVVPQEME
jgi:hypothetical protein